jgi:hypothetical protein
MHKTKYRSWWIFHYDSPSLSLAGRSNYSSTQRFQLAIPHQHGQLNSGTSWERTTISASNGQEDGNPGHNVYMIRWSCLSSSKKAGISDFLFLYLKREGCLYLHVNSSLADIVTADGSYIRQEIVECNRISQRSSQWTWPQQPDPTLQQQDNWKEAITKHLLTQWSKKHLRLLNH